MTKSPNPVDMYVGNRVRMRRLMLNLSQTRLANGLGVAFQQVQKYEKGINRISASRLQQMSHILQVPISFFFEGLLNPTKGSKNTPDAPSHTYVSDFVATSEGLSLVKAFMQIKHSDLRRCIVRLVQQVATQFPPT